MYFEEFGSPQWRMMSQVSRPSPYCWSERRPYPHASKVCVAFPDVHGTMPCTSTYLEEFGCSRCSSWEDFPLRVCLAFSGVSIYKGVNSRYVL